MWQSNFVEANGLKLHYTRTGGNKPAIVLLHGITDAGLCWMPVAERLASNYDVIMLDARGHGQSDRAATYSWVALAEDAHAVIKELGLEKPIILGHSLGALTAMLVAGMYPDTPGAILAEDPPAHWTDRAISDEDFKATHDRFSERLAWLQEMDTQARISLQQDAEPRWSEAELGPWAEAKGQVTTDVLELIWTGENQAVRLSGVKCPVLLITGDTERGAIVSPDDATHLQNLIPQIQVAHIADASHNIRRDEFDEYMVAVRSFLDTLN